MGRNEVSTSVVKWSEGIISRVSIIIRRYIDYIKFTAYKALSSIILSYSFGYIFYHCVCGCMFCTLLFNFRTCVLTTSDENQLKIFERKILRKINGPTQNPDGTWRIKTKEELRQRMKQEDIIKFIKSQRLRWVAHVMRMENKRTTRKITEGSHIKQDQ